LANRIRNHLWEEVRDFVESDKLFIGICNGFQVMANLGLLPATNRDYGDRQIALVDNDSARYLDRWVDLEFGNHSVWTRGLEKASFPIAHGEGKFYTNPDNLRVINEKGLVAAKYTNGEICQAELLPANPNGSLEDIAAISDESGRLIGMMPHPERAIEFTQLPHWTLLKEQLKRKGEEIPTEASGIYIFKNGVEYFS
jgi:phosphoribosylformylglycinamidine synthase subunit PurQ / glutaminase